MVLLNDLVLSPVQALPASRTATNSPWNRPAGGPELPTTASTWTACTEPKLPRGLWTSEKAADRALDAGNGQPAYSYAVGQPHYQATASVPSSSNYCESDKLPVTARRTVTVDGQVITFSRSVNL